MTTDEIKGIWLGSSITGSVYKAQAFDTAETSPNDSEQVKLDGRLIGFGVTTAMHTFSNSAQMMRIYIV